MYVLRRFRTAALASLALLALTATLAQAQRPTYPIGVPANRTLPINPNPYVAPGVTLQQYAYNVRTLSRAYSTIPPYLLGYNPYPNVVVAPQQYPLYNPVSPLYNPALSTAYNPYLGNPYLATNPGAVAGPSLSTTPGYSGGGYDPSLYTNPYLGSPYANPYTDPTYGALRGVADLTNATAQYYVTIQRAKLLQEEVTRSRVETRRLILEEAERERKNMPNPEVIRQKEVEVALDRARHDPPLTELLSGKSLNDLYVHLAKQQNNGFRGPNVPLDDLDLTQLNVAPVGEAGNIGLVKNLKQGDKLSWPSVLLEKQYAESREKLDSRLPDAITRLRTQKPTAEGDIRDLEDSVKKMTETLNASIGDLSPSQYITGKRFLNQLQDAITAIKSPNAINYFNGTWTAKGKNVAELVNNMKGLKFAPATPGGEGTYRTLLQAMVAYDANMTQIAAKP